MLVELALQRSLSRNSSSVWFLFARKAGSLIPSAIVPWVSGVNLYDVFYAQLTRQEITAEMLEEYPVKKGGSLHFFEFPSGKVESILGTELANELEGVLRMELEFNPGDTLHPAT